MGTEERAALKELVLRGLKALGTPAEVTPQSVGEILKAGLQAQDRTTTEMLAERTERAQIGMAALNTAIYLEANSIGAQERLMQYAQNVNS